MDVNSTQRIYKTVNGIELTVDIFQPSETAGRERNAAIAFFHGGGWCFGEPSNFHGACRRYAAKGFITFSFAYRLCVNADGSFPHPTITPVESTQDARSALRWLKANAAELRIDPERIIACGQSAGGQLAYSTAMLDHINEETDDLEVDPTPAALLIYAGTPNTMEVWVDNLLGERRKEIWSISPHHNVKPGLPPVIAFHGKVDRTVPFWVVGLFKQRMAAAGNAFELIPYEGRAHHLGEGEKQYAEYFDEEILERTDRFLAEQGLMPVAG